MPAEQYSCWTGSRRCNRSQPEQAALRAVALQATGQSKPAEAVLQRGDRGGALLFSVIWPARPVVGGHGPGAQAQEYFGGLVERMPDSRLLRSIYAQLLVAAGDWPAAEAQWRAVLRLVPDDESALAPLLRRLDSTGRAADMLGLMQEAHAYNPRSFANNQRLVEYFEGRSQPAQMVAFMQDLAESGPVDALLFRDLAQNLETLGRRVEARDALLRGRRVAQQEGETELLAEINLLLQKP